MTTARLTKEMSIRNTDVGSTRKLLVAFTVFDILIENFCRVDQITNMTVIRLLNCTEKFTINENLTFTFRY